MAERYYTAAPVSKRLYGYESERFECYFLFLKWTHISLGLHIDISIPNIELHIPCGFIRIGLQPNPQVYRERQQYLRENPQ